LNVLDRELASGLIGLSDGPGQSPSAEAEGIHLKLKFAQSLVIELDLDLGQFEFGAERLIGAAEPNVFGDDSLVPSQAQSGELEIDSALAEFFEEGFFYKTGEADLVNVNQATEERQNEEPDCDSRVTETNPASPPKASSFGRLWHGAAY